MKSVDDDGVGIITNHRFNTLRLGQNGRQFADDIFKHNFLNENVLISNTIWLKFIPKGPIDNNTVLVEIMDWRRAGDKPLSQPMQAYIGDVYMRHLASMRYVTIFFNIFLCVSVNNLQVVDICSVVEMTLTSAMLVSPSWHDDVEQPVHCQCHILVQENTPLEVKNKIAILMKMLIWIVDSVIDDHSWFIYSQIYQVL